MQSGEAHLEPSHASLMKLLTVNYFHFKDSIDV